MENITRLKSKFVSSRPDQRATAAITSYPLNDPAGLSLFEGALDRKSFYFQQRTGKLDMRELDRKSFYFQQRTGKLDMRAIGRINVDKVVKEVDIDTLQVYLENITYADLTEDDLRLYSDQCFLNLFRVSQLILEYLLSVQDTLVTSLEVMASKHVSVQKAVHESRAELQAASSRARALKREVRQKRATIARYEQLLAVPGLPVQGNNASSALGGRLSHSCLVCGKTFTSADFLQQHIARKQHVSSRQQVVGPVNSPSAAAAVEGDTKDSTQNEEKQSGEFPSQLRLFVQMDSGQCLNMMVHSGATVGQLRGYINSAAGLSTAAGPSTRLLYKGMHLHDDQRLNEETCRIPTESQILLIGTAEGKSLNEGKIGSPRAEGRGDGEEVSETSKQMAALLSLVRQQLEWNMRTETGRNKHDVEAVEALEIRIRGMEASLPRRLEEFMEESVGNLKSSLREALDDMEMLHTKRSNAGALEDDYQDNENKLKEEEKETSQMMITLADEMTRVSQEEDLLREQTDVKRGAADPVPHPAAIADEPHLVVPPVLPQPLPQSSGVQHEQQVSPHEARESPGPTDDARPRIFPGPTGDAKPRAFPGPTDDAKPREKSPPRRFSSRMWDLSFPTPENASRPEVTVRVARDSTCETVCEAIASKLGVAEARVVLLDKRRGGGTTVPHESSSSELRHLYEGGYLKLEVLQGSVLSDNVVDRLADFYERHVPVEARNSDTVKRSMAEVELAAAKRHAIIGEDSTRLGAEKQMETIRAHLSASLSPGDRVFSSPDKPDQSRDIGRILTRTAPEDPCLTEIDVLGREEKRLSREELERIVEERKRGRPLGLERQMTNVSKSVEKQLSAMLREAEGELEQLELEDSFGSGTYISTDHSMNEGAQQQTLTVPSSSRPITERDGP